MKKLAKEILENIKEIEKENRKTLIRDGNQYVTDAVRILVAPADTGKENGVYQSGKKSGRNLC